MESSGGFPAPVEAVTAELTFDAAAYIVSARCVGGDTLEVAVELKEDASTWSASFPAKYVEEIAAKTGSFKRFPVFVKMLLSALCQESDSVFVDLLTYGDLELLRSKRASAGGGTSAAAAAQPPQPAAQHSNKRYLILTYAAEFDRVHYPMPLQFEEHPDPRRLRATIRTLRAQLATATLRGGGAGMRRSASASASASSPQLKQLREENATLRERLAAIEGSSSGSALAADVQALAADAQETVRDARALRRERDALLARAQQAEAALEGERNLHRRELRRRAKEVADAECELAAAKEHIRELRLKCRELVAELDLAQRRAAVANMSASMRPQAGHILPASAGRGGAAGASRGVSPAGSRYHSRDASPAPIRRAPLPGQGGRSRSAEPSRPGSRPTSRPISAGRFDPTEFVKAKREREREAQRRLDEMRRMARMQAPGGSRAGSLPGSRAPSMPSSRHSTPQRSRVPSRDPSADRAQQRAARDRSVERSWQAALGNDPRERGAAVRSTERLRAAAISTTTPRGAAPTFPPRDQRAASPGRALQEVRQRLQHYAHQQTGGSGGGRVGRSSPRAAQQQQQRDVQEVTAAGESPKARMPHTGDHYADASAEIADIDSRLQSLQHFLRSAKAGQAVTAPA